ncbi:MAG: sensor histidine kinase [Polyangiaceae bacterium]|jgi:signal transduction histidine kinase|nr:sensor histidine kinase [Polyangiaceae bacterium]
MNRDFGHMCPGVDLLYVRTMPLPRPLRLLAIALYAIAGASELADPGPRGVPPTAWLLSYLAFGLGLSLAQTDGSPRRRLGALAVQMPALLAMAWLVPCRFGALLLVIVAWQVALLFPPKVLAAWIGAQTLAVGLCLCSGEDVTAGASYLIGLLGFQVFAAVTVLVVQREAEAKAELARANAELRATRALLAETSRAQERARIAREMHDVLGHGLTALGLQLEVARHLLPEGEALTHVVKARRVGANLLRDVREVVGRTREVAGSDLREALRVLVEDTPGLHVHLDVPEPFLVEDGERAHCVLRCVQEVVTNTLRHAGARNLWVVLRSSPEGVTIDARDDGRCARAVCPGGGLSGMAERVREVGGTLAFESRPSRPFALSAWLPGRAGTA